MKTRICQIGNSTLKTVHILLYCSTICSSMPSRNLSKDLIRKARVFTSRKSSSPLRNLTIALLLLTVVFVLRLAVGIFSVPVDRKFPEHEHIVNRLASGRRGRQWTEIVSWEPRAMIYHNFLSAEECDYLIEIAKPRMVKSMVVDSKTGKSVDSSVRTSSGVFMRRGQDRVISAIEKRIADFTFIPAEHGEGLHVLHYDIGQKYDAHLDYFQDEVNTKNGGQRMATLLMYLSDVEEGGETVFPSVKVNITSPSKYEEFSECARKGLAVKPRKGDALLFFSMRPDASLDPASLHEACPVIKGSKWSCTKWMRVHEYAA